jgi:hypothetical protein
MPGKKKRKKARSAKQKAATKKMLAANLAARSAGKRKVKSRRTAARHSTPAPSPSGKLRPRKKPRSAKQKAATKKMLAAAHRDERGKPRKKKHHKKSSKSGSRSKHHRTPKVRVVRAAQVKLPPHTTNITVAAIPAAHRTSRRGKGKGKGKSKSAKRKAAAKKGAATRKRNAKKAGTWHTQIKRSAAAEHYPMENPLGVAEVLVGTFTGLLGFGSSELIDRLLATHALTGTAQPYTDPAATNTSQASILGSYTGMYTGTAILAPMDLGRWAAGLGLAIVPIAVASQVSDPIGRSALQMFGFGALMRVGGKGLTDLCAYLTSGTMFGNQVFVNEERAQTFMTGATLSAGNLPTSGLGRPAGVGGGHHGHWLSNGAPVPPPGTACACGNNACGGCGGSAPRPPVRPPATSASSAQAANCPPPPPPPPPQIVQLPCPAPQVTSTLSPQTTTGGYTPVSSSSTTGGGTVAPQNWVAAGHHNPQGSQQTPPQTITALQGLPRGLSGTGAPPLAMARLGAIRPAWGYDHERDPS